MAEITRYREVKKMNNYLGIHLLALDVKDLGIKEGDMVDISDCIVLSKELYRMKIKKGIVQNGEEKFDG